MRTLWLWILLLTVSNIAVSAEVNIYSARKAALIKPLLDVYSEETGVTINIVTGKADALIKRLELEGKNSPADLLLTVDVGRLYRAKQANLLQPIQSEVLAKRIPTNYRDAEGYWFGLSLRSRIIVYAKDRVALDKLSSYEALADSVWKGQLCVRSSSNIYNQSGYERFQSTNKFFRNSDNLHAVAGICLTGLPPGLLFPTPDRHSAVLAGAIPAESTVGNRFG